jgi:TatA/E family protein of Tat protein translocase
MFGVGTTEMIIVGCVAVLLFGSRLPKVARSVGQSIVEFKRGFMEVEAECAHLEKKA